MHFIVMFVGNRKTGYDKPVVDICHYWRRGRDSNPGAVFGRHSLSRRAPSADSVTSPSGLPKIAKSVSVGKYFTEKTRKSPAS